MNINRDYLIINDVKKSNVKLDNGSVVFYITDKNTQNIFVNLVINISNNPLIQKYANIENAEDYTLTMNIVKPDNTHEIIQGKLHDKANAIFEFDLPDYCCDKVGSYRCELLTKCYINDKEEITTSNRLTYKVKSSVLNDLDEMVEAPEYPLVIQLFDKLSDIEQYEEDRRANELARQLAEEQRQARFNALDADMVDSIQAMDNKVVEVENRITTKEQAVDKLIVDTKANIDNYKEAKDQEIDEYKTAKDTEINEAIANQNTTINAQNDRITVVENNDVTQNNKLDVLETKATTHEERITATEVKNTEQDNRLDVAENRLANIGNDITNTMQPIIDAHTSRLDAIEAIDVAQNNRLDNIEAKNQQQDDRLLDIEKVNNKQAVDIKCLYGASQTIDVTKEGNSIYLQNSNNGFTIIDEIKGNTLVNCNKEPDKELILNGNINTSGDNTVTITEGVDGGLVDVALEGNTLVNVSKTKDSTAVTKAYTVENSGNHIALQGDVDGICKPVIEGNTLVNIIQSYSLGIGTEYNFSTGSLKCTGDGTPKRLDYQVISKTSTTYTVIANIKKNTINNNFALVGWNITEENKQVLVPNGFTGLFVSKFTTRASDLQNGWCTDLWKENTEGEIEIDGFMLLEGDYTDKPIPDYFTGLQSSFEDNLVTQEMVDSGKEVADNLGKYRVDYKTVGKNKYNQIKTPFKPGPIALEGATITNNGDNIVLNGTLTKVFDYRATWLDELYNYVNSCQEGTVLTLSNNLNGVNYWMYTENGSVHFDQNSVTIRSSMSNISCFVRFNEGTTFNESILNVQIEEGDTATSYEPYKEHTKTLYLNSPPLEGDTIEEKDGGIYHVHRSEKLVLDGSELGWQDNAGEGDTVNGHGIWNANLTDGIGGLNPVCDKLLCVNSTSSIANKTNFILAYAEISTIVVNIANAKTREDVINWLQNNKPTIIRKLITPTYELIEQSNLVIPSYANGHLDFNTAVPVEKVEFKPFSEELTYLYPSTSYTVQFVSDRATLADITLGGTELLAQSIVAGLNRISITTPETLVNNKLTINGVGASISKVVVTDTDRQFGYFEGMKSVGECEELAITSANSDNTSSNTQQLTHEPLRGVGDAKDRYVLIDGKWYIERKTGYKDLVITKGTSWAGDVAEGMIGFYNVLFLDNNKYESAEKIVCDKLPTIGRSKLSTTKYDAIVRGGDYVGIVVKADKLETQDLDGLKKYINSLNAKFIHNLTSPQYELIDYNPLEVYSGTTHITTNSAIPTNITVKNAGFNCLLKPSTTYTISSNLGLNTVTTPDKLTEDCLRFMDTDTSNVTTMKDVLVLEGDWTTKADLIPANFSGIESVFEQEYDVEKGKYKVNIKVANEDKTKENNITFYTNEPLRGVGDVKDRVYVKDDKVVVQRNCASVTLDGSDDENYTVWVNANKKPTQCVFVLANSKNIFKNIALKPDEMGAVKYTSDKFNSGDVSKTGFICQYYRDMHLALPKACLKNEDNLSVKQWLQQNPATVVYQLSDPTYEEVEYNDTKLFIESFKNSTLFYNSNVPVSSKLYYSYSVPIVDTVAQTASISDEQDQLIIDLATQVAVLEMMTM